MRQKVYFKTFGCRTNMFDSQVMMSALQNYDITQNESEADIVIVNSCTVTNSADSTVRGYINQLKKHSPGSKVYLTGCGAHTKGESLLKTQKIEGVFGQSEKNKIESLLLKPKGFYELGDLNFVDGNIVEEFIGKSRAFIKIQEGCNFECSYCIIPSVRGRARSSSQEQILEQVRRLASNGFGEFILTGTNVGSYGQGQKSSIAALMKKMSLIRGVRRIRVGSIEPIQINDEFKEILDEPWMEKHLHIAIQHSSSQMLKIMNRRNRFESDIKLFDFIASKGYAIGTDYIVAHPGESEQIWKEAVDNLKTMPLTHLHAFTFSPRDNTPSALMKERVGGDIAKRRLNEINEIVKEKNYLFRKNTKATLEVLVESFKDDYYIGYDQFFNKIKIKSNEDIIGDWINFDRYEVTLDENMAEF